MNAEKLMVLHDLLLEDAENPEGVMFDLGVVTGFSPLGREKLESGEDVEYGIDCGTAACAMGLAALSDKFPEIEPHSGSMVVLSTYGQRGVVSYLYAAVLVFDITPAVAEDLFDPMNYPSEMRKGSVAEKLVAERIRNLIEPGEAGTRSSPSGGG